MSEKNGRCRVCNNNEELQFYNVKERMLNTGDVFEYLYCPKCGTLQLNSDVKDMGKYYGESYYSFNAGSSRMKLPRIVVKPFLHFYAKTKGDYPAKLSTSICKLSSMIYGTGVSSKDAILDIGGAMAC